MNKKYPLALFIVLAFVFNACTSEKKQILSDEDIVHENTEQLTKVIIYDVFSPPVASRIYVYTSLATYETIRFSEPGKYPSLLPEMNGFTSAPQPQRGKDYNYTLAATQAFFTVARKVVFSVDSFKIYEQKVYEQFRNQLDDSTYQRSVNFGNQMAKVILARAGTDNYLQTRGMPKFIGDKKPGTWKPTPPDYFDAVENHWGVMKTFVLDSTSQFLAPPPPPYLLDTNSVFFKANVEVYNIDKNLTETQKDIARYWDDNPFVMEHSGHMMFANKKITPGGHWMGIARIASKKSKAGPVKAAQAYALTGIALFDAFVSCWDEKYRSNIIRPITVINEYIDPNWSSLLQTPPFPEYPSGHSTITRAVATVLTHLFGDNFSFHDDSDLEYIGMQKDFTSFVEAADEASISRVYGGIHYVHSINAGAALGKRIGDYIVQKLKI